MKTLSVLILAAGQSKRMGQNKLSLLVEGQPLVRRTVLRAINAGVGKIMVVTGHEAIKTRALLHGLDVKFCHNQDFATGLLSSLQAGLKQLPAEISGAMIVLADQIFLNPQTLRALAESFQNTTDAVLLAPCFAGQRGHPVIVDRGFFHEVFEAKEDPEKGAQFLFRRHPDAIRLIHFPGGPESQDLDTPQEYQRIIEDLRYQNHRSWLEVNHE